MIAAAAIPNVTGKPWRHGEHQDEAPQENIPEPVAMGCLKCRLFNLF